MMKKYFLLSAILFLFSGQALAGITSVPVMMQDAYSASEVSLANISVIQRGKVSLFQQNPALLASLEKRNAAFSYQPWIFDTYFLNGAFSYSLKPVNLGIGLTFFGSKEFEYYDMKGNLADDKLDMSEMLLTMGAGRRVLSTEDVILEAGLSVKYLSSSIYKESASALALDLGASGYYNISNFDEANAERLIFGLSIQNLGSAVKYKEGENDLPAKFRIGMGYQYPFSDIIFTPMMELLTESKTKFSIGAEGGYKNFLFVRIAYLYDAYKELFSGICFGLGVQYKKITFDYGLKLSSEDEQSALNTVSLGYSF